MEHAKDMKLYIRTSCVIVLVSWFNCEKWSYLTTSCFCAKTNSVILISVLFSFKFLHTCLAWSHSLLCHWWQIQSRLCSTKWNVLIKRLLFSYFRILNVFNLLTQNYDVYLPEGDSNLTDLWTLFHEVLFRQKVLRYLIIREGWQ